MPQTNDNTPKRGRPRGALSTEQTDVVARLRAARADEAQTQIAADLGLSPHTFNYYFRKGIAPANGPVRVAIERALARAEKNQPK